MKKVLFEGSCVALVTPFTEDGVDFPKLRELLEWHIAEGTDAILVCGTTGEASTMPDEEHKEVIRFAVEVVAKRVHLMANTGSNDTKHAIELSQYAEKVGADSLLSVSPYYNKTTQEGLYRHFKAIADAVSIPVVLYNIPGRTGLDISPSILTRLSQVQNIVGVKECNLGHVADTMFDSGDNLAFWSGDDGSILPLLSLGGSGVISVMANIIPKDTHDMVAAWLSGDVKKARNMQVRVALLIRALFCEVNPIPIKAAMNLMGMNVGTPRMPLVEMSDAGVLQLKAAMKEYGLLG